MSNTMTAHRVLAPSTFRRMPWKNGGGRTTEIFVEPPGAPLDDFAWRVSVADVNRSGPFSTFPGVDRTLVLLSGNGVRLTGDGTPLELAQPFEPVRFAGDVPLQCTLIAGPVRDFNLMARRGVVLGEVRVLREGGDALPRARAYLCYAALGASECLIAGHGPITLPEEHALLVEAGTTGPAPGLHVNPLTTGAVALVAAIGNA